MTIQHPSVCGRALALRRTVVVPDVMADPDFWPYRDVAVRAGFRAVQSTPMLTSGGSLVGVISTHADRIHRPSDEQLSAIANLARSTADSIMAVRTHGHAADHHYTVHRAEAEWRKAHGVEQGISPEGRAADAH